MSNLTRFIAYRTNNEFLDIRPCGMNDIVYINNKYPSGRQITAMRKRVALADYDFIAIFDEENHYATYSTK